MSQSSKPSHEVDSPQGNPVIAPEEYTLGWVCALPLEMAAAKGMLDKVHPNLVQQDPADHNSYILGEVWGHNVVVACLPAGIYGTTPAATVAKDMLRTFRSIRFGLMVGIGGGAPSKKQDIRLGDIVVGQPTGTNGGLIQYDRGKTLQQGEFQRTGSLNTPPQVLLAALSRLQADHLTEDSRIPEFLAELVAKSPKKMKKKFSYQGESNDCLYSAEYDHVDPDSACDQCDPAQTIQRETRDDTDPGIHYGAIASGNQVMKDGKTRDKLSKELGALCFEMEAAGLQDFPCLVIRGICDYADSHKNKTWQEYAAATAAAFAKELLSIIPPDRVLQEKPIPQLVSIANEHLQVAKQHLSLTSEHLSEHKRTNQILEKRPIDLYTVHEARYDSADVVDSPRCESDTRIRIRQSITQWADGDSGEPLFWLVGPAGTGKSTTIRTIADTFSKNKRLAAGYFFKRGDQGRNDTNRLFSTLAMQLADSIPSFEGCLRTSLGTLDKDAVEKKGLEFQFETLLWLPLRYLPPINTSHLPKVIIIDALDECERHEHLPRVLGLLLRLCNINTTRLRVLFTSRSAPNIVEAFRHHVKYKIVRTLQLHREFSKDTENDIRKFLETRFTDIKIKRSVEQDPWPTIEELNRLVQLSTNPEPLFIYAATLVRFVYDEQRPRNPKNQLKLWLKQCEDNKSQLHQIYSPILSQLFLGNEEEESSQQLQFLGALALLATPLPTISLAVLLNMDMDDISWWLPELHAVLDIPNERHKPIRLLHKSFSDFLLNRDDSEYNKYRVDAAETHATLASRAIQRMKEALKQDICDIKKPGTLIDTINEDRISRCISADLRYACLYWFHHLQHSRRSLDTSVYTFMYDHFLHWLEVLSLLGQLISGATILKGLLDMIQKFPDTPPEFVHFIQDAKRVISTFGSIIQRAPLQVYSSLLFFSPATNKIRQMFWNRRIPRLGHVQGIKSYWDARLQTLEGHDGYVDAVAFSPDGQLLASASQDHTVRLWNPVTGTQLQILKGHSGPVDMISFSPCSCFLASASLDQTIRIWNVTTGAYLHRLQGYFDSISAIAFSPDSDFILSASDKSIRLWDVHTGEWQRIVVSYDEPFHKAAFSPCCRLLASSLSDSSISIWNLVTGLHHCTLGLVNHVEMADALAFSPDSCLLASGSWISGVLLWDVATGALRNISENMLYWTETLTFSPDSQTLAIQQTENVLLVDVRNGADKGSLEVPDLFFRSVAFSPDNQLLASGLDDATVQLWDVTLGDTIESSDDQGGYITDIVISTNGQQVASSSRDRTVRLWDASTVTLQYILVGHRDFVTGVLFSPDSKLLASAASDGTIRIWNTNDGVLQQVISDYSGSISAISYSPNSQLVVSASTCETRARLWNMATGEHYRVLEGHNGSIDAVSFSPDGLSVATASRDGSLRVWDASTGIHRQTLDGHEHYVSNVFFSPDSKLIASVLYGGLIWVWDLAACLHLHRLQHGDCVYTVAFSPDNRLIASSSSNRTVWLWNTVLGTHQHTLKGYKGHAQEIIFSPDSQVIAVAWDDRSVRLWSITTATHVHSILSHTSIVTVLKFSPDGKTLATASRDKIIRLWDLSSRTQLQTVRYDEGIIKHITFLPQELLVSVSKFESDRFWTLWNQMALELHRYRITYTPRRLLPDPVFLGISIDANGEWISQGSENLVWLPPEYRPESWDARDSTIFLGCASGRITQFQVK